MAFTVQCPSCERKYRIGKGHLGKSITCPGCKKAFEVAPGPMPWPISADPTELIIPAPTEWAEPGRRQPRPRGRDA